MKRHSVLMYYFVCFQRTLTLLGMEVSLFGQWEFGPRLCTEGRCTALVLSCRTRAFKGSTEERAP